jgi:hypothetical protein
MCAQDFLSGQLRLISDKTKIAGLSSNIQLSAAAGEKFKV